MMDKLGALLDQLADPATPNTTISALQTEFVRLIKERGHSLLGPEPHDQAFEKLASQCFSQIPKIRANTFRCLSLSLPKLTATHVERLHIDLFLVRAIDTGGGKDGTEALEGVEALKFISNLQNYGTLPRSLLSCLLSLVRSTHKENFRKCATAIISCYALRQQESFIECGGMKGLLEAIAMGGEHPETEALVQVFMFLFNGLKSRDFFHLRHDIGFIVASLSEPHIVLFEKERVKGESKKDNDYTEERKVWLQACVNAILSISRTWPGLYTMEIILNEMTGALWRPFPKIQRAVVECFYQMLHLHIPTELETFDKALRSVIDWQAHSEWSIKEDWLVGEAEELLSPHHIERPNVVDIYQAHLLALILAIDPKLDALTHVAINGQHEEAILASILVGELLHLINRFSLSQQHIAHIQPMLVSAVAEHQGYGVESSQCIAKLLHHRQQPTTKLSFQLRLIKERVLKFKNFRSHYRDRDYEDHEERQHIRFIENTRVFDTDHVFTWDWKSIASVLELGFLRTHSRDEMCVRFLKRVMEAFSQNMVLVMLDCTKGHSNLYTAVGVSLINLLLEIGSSEIEELKGLIPAFLRNMSNELVKSQHGKGIFSPTTLRTTLVSDYFFLIGTLYSGVEGNKYLKGSNIFEIYLTLFEKSPDKALLKKCVLVSLMYGNENITDVIFSTILHRGSVDIRIFAVRFLRILIRTGYQNFEKFILPMLVSQLYAYSSAGGEEIAEEALSVLTEACQDNECLEHLFDTFPALLHLGDKGYQLVLRYLSIPRGFEYLSSLGFLDAELERWKTVRCVNYVRDVEMVILEALTGYKRGEATFRVNKTKWSKYCFTPVHLYGELAQTDAGIERLSREKIFDTLDSMLTQQDETLIKAAAWAIGHIGASSYGFAKLSQFDFVRKIHSFSVSHGSLGVRGTCLYVLNLICKTESGCVAVEQLNFIASRKEFIHHFSICSSKKIPRLAMPVASELMAGNRQRSSTLQPPRHKTHMKNRSLGESQLNFILQSVNGAQFECKDTLPGEKIGLCIPDDILKFFTLEKDFKWPHLSELMVERSDDEQVEKMLELVASLSCTLRANVHVAELEEMLKTNKTVFSEFKNYVSAHRIMSKFRFKQASRRFIHKIFDSAVIGSSSSNQVHVTVTKSPSLYSVSSSGSVVFS